MPCRAGKAVGKRESRGGAPVLEPAEPRLLLTGLPLGNFTLANDSSAAATDPAAGTAGTAYHYDYVLWDRSTRAPAKAGDVPAATAAPYGLSPTAIRGAYGIDSINVGGVMGDGVR